MANLCFVSAFYNEEPNLGQFLRELDELAGKLAQRHGLTSSVLLVDDGSSDNYRHQLEHSTLQNIDVDVLVLSRNFGKELALSAGLSHAEADAVVIMDSDLQHPPELVLEFVRLWQSEGKDVVYAYKKNRKGEGLIKAALVRLHNAILNGSSRTKIPRDAGDFRLMSRRVVEALNDLSERERYMKGLFAWVGFEQHGIAYEPRQRNGGKTKWKSAHLLELSINGIVSFSTMPIRLISVFGAIVALASILYGVWIVIEKLVFGNEVAGFPALATMVSFIGAVQLICIGIIGEYVARLVSEAKRRPLFIVKDRWRLGKIPLRKARATVAHYS